MLKQIRHLIRNWLGVYALQVQVQTLEEENKGMRNTIRRQSDVLEASLRELREYTRVDADISPYHRGQCSVIVTGVFRGTGFVSFYDMDKAEFEDVVKFLRHKERHALIRNVDAPHGFRASFNI